MTTYISNNIKKTSERIDPEGNIINPKTKQIIQPNIVEEAQPTPVSQNLTVEATETPKPSNLSSKINDLVEAKIKARIDEIVEQRVNDALKNI